MALVAAFLRGSTKGVCKAGGGTLEHPTPHGGRGQKWCDQTAAPAGKKKWPGDREKPCCLVPVSLTRNVESTEEGSKALSDPPGATDISEEAVLCGGL